MTRCPLFGLALVALVCARPCAALETKAPSVRDLATAVQQHGAEVDADRAVVRKALERPEVREVAQRVGIDLNHIAATIDTLPPSDVATAAQAAQQVNKRLTKDVARDELDGGRKHLISYTTVLISALLAVLLVVLVQ